MSRNAKLSRCIRICNPLTNSYQTMKRNSFGGQITTTTKQEPIHYINPRVRGNYTNNQNSQRGRDGLRGRPYTRETQNAKGQQAQNNYITQKQYFKCGRQFGLNPLQSRPAKHKICSKCAKRDQFAKVCGPTRINYL